MSTPGPKELANRANADAKRERKLIPYAGKTKDGRESHYGNRAGHGEPKPPRKRRKYKRKIT